MGPALVLVVSGMNVIQYAARRAARVTGLSVLAIGGLIGTEGPGAPSYAQSHGKICTYLPERSGRSWSPTRMISSR
jgi:hypothetical protein